MTSPIYIHRVNTQKDLLDFVNVPNHLYKSDPFYVSQLTLERMEHLSSKNPYFSHATHQFFVAYQDKNIVGRISAQIDEAAQKDQKNQMGHFGFIDAKNKIVLRMLIEEAENWLKESGADLVHGPYSLSINDEAGLLVDGFNSTPYMMMNHAPKWLGNDLEDLGYKKAKDLLAFHMKVNQALPDGIMRMASKALETSNIKIRNLDKKNIENDLRVVLKIFNQAWINNWGFVPMNQEEITYSAKNMKPLIRPELVKIIEVDSKAVAMIVALPNLNEALEGLNGRLLPFGWAKLLWRLKNKPKNSIHTARVLLMGVCPEYQSGFLGSAIASALIVELYKALQKDGYKDAELSWILEDNMPMIRLIESAQGRSYKRYRIYKKDIS